MAKSTVAAMLQCCTRVFGVGTGIDRAAPRLVEPLDGLQVLRHPVRTAFEATVYEPVLCLVVQGRKQTTFGEHAFDIGVGQCVLVSHDLPVVSRE